MTPATRVAVVARITPAMREHPDRKAAGPEVSRDRQAKEEPAASPGALVPEVSQERLGWQARQARQALQERPGPPVTVAPPGLREVPATPVPAAVPALVVARVPAVAPVQEPSGGLPAAEALRVETPEREAHRQ